MGMTFIAMGVAEEAAGYDITANALWPATMVESFATKNFEMGSEDMWRKASILADATLEIVKSNVTGQVCDWVVGAFGVVHCSSGADRRRLSSTEGMDRL